MELITTINQRLIDHYGLDTSTGQPMFRVVWADDQTEKRRTDRLDSGIQLLYPVVREVKKYPYLKAMHVLERLVVVPEVDQHELADAKLSYEPIWAYKDGYDQPIPPMWEPTKFVVDTLYAALGKKSMAKYKEVVESPEEAEIRLNALTKELFGNETDAGDALAYHEGVTVPHNYEGSK